MDVAGSQRLFVGSLQVKPASHTGCREGGQLTLHAHAVMIGHTTCSLMPTFDFVPMLCPLLQACCPTMLLKEGRECNTSSGTCCAVQSCS